jgi:rRNA maturation RNase YbeY
MANDSIYFFQEDRQYRLRNKKFVRKWIADSVVSENKTPGEINIIFCSDEYLHKINIEYLKHNSFTDIITFDYSSTTSISGDLFISIDRVKENSVIFNKHLTDELHRVIIHGILHLCGYDDKTPRNKEIMTSRENYHLDLRPVEISVT